MKGLFKNVALGFVFYIGWEFAKGMDTALGAIFNEDIIRKSNEIQERIKNAHEKCDDDSEQKTEPHNEESECQSLYEEMLDDLMNKAELSNRENTNE